MLPPEVLVNRDRGRNQSTESSSAESRGAQTAQMTIRGSVSRDLNIVELAEDFRSPHGAEEGP